MNQCACRLMMMMMIERSHVAGRRAGGWTPTQPVLPLPGQRVREGRGAARSSRSLPKRTHAVKLSRTGKTLLWIKRDHAVTKRCGAQGRIRTSGATSRTGSGGGQDKCCDVSIIMYLRGVSARWSHSCRLNSHPHSNTVPFHLSFFLPEY